MYSQNKAEVRHMDHVDVTEPPAITREVMDLDSVIPYRMTATTYIALVSLGVTWGTTTLSNVGPSTTYTYAIEDLGGSSVESWIPNAALFPLIGLQPVWGTLADRFGKKWPIIVGGVAGVVGNLIAGFARNAETIIGGQVVNGVGASLLLLVIPAGMEIVPAKDRGFAQGFMGIINATMAIVGLIVAGAFGQMSSRGWRWVYYFNAIFFGISAVATLFFYTPPPTLLRRHHSPKEMLQSIDIFGIVLLLAGVASLITALTWGGNSHPWNSAAVISTLVLGGVFLVAFGLYETLGRKDGLVDHRFLQDRNFVFVLAVAFVDGMILYGVNAFLPTEGSSVFGAGPIMVNVYLLPLNICIMIGILGSSYVITVLQHFRILLSVSMGVIALFLGLLALATPSRLAITLVFSGIVGLGVGVTTVIPVVVMSYAVPSYLLGTAGTLLASVRALGGTAGITIFASIYGNSMKANLAHYITGAVLDAGLPPSSLKSFLAAFLGGDTDALTSVPGVTSQIINTADYAEKLASSASFKWVWIANATIGAAATILTLFLRSVRDHMTHHVEAPLEPSSVSEMPKTIV